MRCLLSTTAFSTTAALALGLSGCFPSAPAPSSVSASSPSSVSVSSASSVPSASDARRPPSVAPAASASPAVGRPAVKTALPKRTFTFQGMTSQYAVYADHLAGKRPRASSSASTETASRIRAQGQRVRPRGFQTGGAFDAVGESAAAPRTYRGIGMKRASRVRIRDEGHNGSIRSEAGMLRKIFGGESVPGVPCPDEKG